jgi:hypothetical protein
MKRETNPLLLVSGAFSQRFDPRSALVQSRAVDALRTYIRLVNASHKSDVPCATGMSTFPNGKSVDLCANSRPDDSLSAQEDHCLPPPTSAPPLDKGTALEILGASTNPPVAMPQTNQQASAINVTHLSASELALLKPH